MSSSRQASNSTRERLLEAACRTFAEKGFSDATVSVICKRANANIAAVNYHFHSKEHLYVEAWRRAFEASIATYPPDGGVPDNAPPADRLRGRIVSLISRILDPETIEFDIVHKELASPTGLLDEVFAECVWPLQKAFQDVVRELLGPSASQRDVVLCQRSIVSQCLHLLMITRRGRTPIGSGPMAPPELVNDVQALGEHVVRFSLAGIAEIRRTRMASPTPETGRGAPHA